MLNVIVLSAIMLNAIMLSVIILNVVMLSVAAPMYTVAISKKLATLLEGLLNLGCYSQKRLKIFLRSFLN